MTLGKLFNKNKTFEQKSKDFNEHVSSLTHAQEEQEVKQDNQEQQIANKETNGDKNEYRNAKETKRKTRQTNKQAAKSRSVLEADRGKGIENSDNPLQQNKHAAPGRK